MQAPVIFETAIAPAWLDYNGHLRDASYALVLSLACDALMDRVGLDEAYRRETRCTLYTLEQHLHFLHEVRESDHLRVAVRVLAADHKRMHAAFDLYCDRHPGAVAVGESMLLHVHQAGTPSAAPFPSHVREAIDALVVATAGLAAPGPPSRRLELRP